MFKSSIIALATVSFVFTMTNAVMPITNAVVFFNDSDPAGTWEALTMLQSLGINAAPLLLKDLPQVLGNASNGTLYVQPDSSTPMRDLFSHWNNTGDGRAFINAVTQFVQQRRGLFLGLGTGAYSITPAYFNLIGGTDFQALQTGNISHMIAVDTFVGDFHKPMIIKSGPDLTPALNVPSVVPFGNISLVNTSLSPLAILSKSGSGAVGVFATRLTCSLMIIRA